METTLLTREKLKNTPHKYKLGVWRVGNSEGHTFEGERSLGG